MEDILAESMQERSKNGHVLLWKNSTAPPTYKRRLISSFNGFRTNFPINAAGSHSLPAVIYGGGIESDGFVKGILGNSTP